MDMRAGNETTLAGVVVASGAAHPHTAYLFGNKPGTRLNVLVRDGMGIWLAVRRRHQGRFHWLSPGGMVQQCLQRDQLDALTLTQRANSAAAWMGQVTVIDSVLLRGSTLISSGIGSGIAAGSRNGMNAGAAGAGSTAQPGCISRDWWQPVRACSLSQRCSTLAFMPWRLANAAMDVPGCRQAAISSALKAGV